MEPDEEDSQSRGKLTKANAKKNTTTTPHFPELHGLSGKTSTPFTDHDGQQGISYYYGECPVAFGPILPPLLSYQFYVTFGATAESAARLPEQLYAAVRLPLIYVEPLRLDVNFLPDANVEKCIEHYRSEKAARREAGAPLPFMDPFRSYGSSFSLLVLIDDADWESKGCTVVMFDDDEEPGKDTIHHAIKWVQPSDAQRVEKMPPLGRLLDGIACQSGDESGRDLYAERVAEGRSDWR